MVRDEDGVKQTAGETAEAETDLDKLLEDMDLDQSFDAIMMEESKDEDETNDENQPDWDERLNRNEVFSNKYRPSIAEIKEVNHLQECLGINNATTSRSLLTVMTRAKPKFNAPQEKSWFDVTHGSVLLKRGFVNLRVPKRNDKEGDEAVAPVECHLCLFTKGMSFFTLQGPNERNGSKQLLISVPWMSITHLIPNDEKYSIQIEKLGEADSTLVLENSLAEWKDPITSCLLRYLEINKTTTGLGWQHAIVYTPGFSEAVGDGLLPKNISVTTNAVDDYNKLTPLLYAVKLGHMQAATSLLVDLGADPNQPSEDDGTFPLYWADSEAMTKLLVDHGAKKVERQRQELFGRVDATQVIVDKQRQQQRDAESTKTEMQQNIRLLNERGQKIEEMDDKARELNENATEFKNLAGQLKSQMKQRSGRWGIF